MALHMLVMVSKLKLLTSINGHGQHLLSTFIFPFIIKFTYSATVGFLPISFSDVIFSARVFFFRLNLIVFENSPLSNHYRRWQRVARLVHERVGGPPSGDDSSMHAISMLAL
ncbi:hypothetical protein IHE45_16G032300 [Dioscorea alata]|uniref:Uncharacterized protein n=1 Tax=Dioscorea alata TaxID=55571 RepID=A0ACB7UGR3_DIOAL|nr:hypothetical protein IHE45_16G032300 [Dioscorea alata]